MTTFDNKVIEPILTELHEDIKKELCNDVIFDGLIKAETDCWIKDTKDLIHDLSSEYGINECSTAEFFAWLLMNEIYIKDEYKKVEV